MAFNNKDFIILGIFKQSYHVDENVGIYPVWLPRVKLTPKDTVNGFFFSISNNLSF